MTDCKEILGEEQGGDEIARGKKYYRMGRHAQDMLFSLLALIVLAIPMAIVALIIWIDSPGASPIFVQDRVGRDGKIFKLYKFRSMIPNADARLKEVLDQNEMDGPVFKIKEDPRVTRVGRFIRRTSIDELPQLINILKGNMSIVGPRPALPREVEQYTDYERQRLYVLPGLTCYWQVQPNRNQVPARPQLLAGLETDFSDNRRGTRNVWGLIGCGGRRCAARPAW